MRNLVMLSVVFANCLPARRNMQDAQRRVAPPRPSDVNCDN